jgi:pimeloyl-ACP methyl ester carboxylesterase
MRTESRPLGEAAAALAEQIAGKTDITLIGHSRGGALVMEYLAQVAEGRLAANKELVGAYTIDAPLEMGWVAALVPVAPLRIMAEAIVGQRVRGTLGAPLGMDRYADLPRRLAERGLTVDVATFDNPADFFFTSYEAVPGVPRYEWAVGPSPTRPPFPLAIFLYELPAHGLLSKDPRLASYLSGALRQWG